MHLTNGLSFAVVSLGLRLLSYSASNNNKTIIIMIMIIIIMMMMMITIIIVIINFISLSLRTVVTEKPVALI